MKFHENLFSGSQVVSHKREADRQRDITKLTVIFRNFAKAHKNAMIDQLVNT
jgi:hypothetical protein